MKQVFAYTAPTAPVGLTPYLQAFEMADDRIAIHARHESGSVAAVSLDIKDRVALAKALMRGLPHSMIE